MLQIVTKSTRYYVQITYSCMVINPYISIPWPVMPLENGIMCLNRSLFWLLIYLIWFLHFISHSTSNVAVRLFLTTLGLVTYSSSSFNVPHLCQVALSGFSFDLLIYVILLTYNASSLLPVYTSVEAHTRSERLLHQPNASLCGV